MAELEAAQDDLCLTFQVLQSSRGITLCVWPAINTVLHPCANSDLNVCTVRLDLRALRIGGGIGTASSPRERSFELLELLTKTDTRHCEALGFQ